MCFVNTTRHATWEAAQAARIGQEVQRLRDPRSAAWLASRVGELGLKMTRQTIADLENGRRRYVTTAELIILAAALNTSPVALVYPNPSDDVAELIEVLPGVEVTGLQAAQWFSGIRHGFTDSADGAESAQLRAEFRENTRALRLWRELANRYEQRAQASIVPKAGTLSDAQRQQIEFYDNEIQRLRLELGLDNA